MLAERGPAPGAREYDYVVVGAGSAGCAVAARLSEDPAVSVALVEAGGPAEHPDIAVPLGALDLIGSEVDWAFSTGPQAGMGGRVVPWPRGRVHGGSSAVNFQMWLPGHPADFDDWPPSWSWRAVEPFLRRAERWAGEPGDGGALGVDGPLWISPQRDPDPSTERFLGACEEVGLKRVEVGPGNPDGVGCAPTPVTQRDGARWSSADGYLAPALGRPNLDLRDRALAHRVLLDADRRATGVLLVGGEVLTARREVVLSAGAVGSPHLLLLSGIGPAAELRAAGVDPVLDLPVGRGLRDHLILDLAVGVPGATRFLADGRDRWARERRGPATSNIAEAVAFFRADGGEGPPDLELIWSPMAFAPDGTPVPGYTVGVVLLRPRSRGALTLERADPRVPPRIDPGYLTDPADARALAAGVRFAERVLRAGALREPGARLLDPWPDGDALEGYARERASTVFHPVGTCALGAVVDERLRVRGATGLRVADASVVPEAPRGHTHAHAVLVAERAADLIRADGP
ncbi:MULTISPECIES: GMC family oxidoreductase [Actinosynnema]|uniref:GMC family oxidoreductase n=1 Tax=Actinosynnema TaxID=40566 RepID=UPI0020A26437|nr:GMC family oxidoreductase N-terminal domain-containing protein [Actinosynnema pretiosum]MCP2094462.1 choline dehydrogenase [Actinosynnema pretiosum]